MSAIPAQVCHWRLTHPRPNPVQTRPPNDITIPALDQVLAVFVSIISFAPILLSDHPLSLRSIYISYVFSAYSAVNYYQPCYRTSRSRRRGGCTTNLLYDLLGMSISSWLTSVVSLPLRPRTSPSPLLLRSVPQSIPRQYLSSRPFAQYRW